MSTLAQLIPQLMASVSAEPIETDKIRYKSRLDIAKRREQERMVKSALDGSILTVAQIMKKTGLHKTAVRETLIRLGNEVRKCGVIKSANRRPCETYTISL